MSYCTLFISIAFVIGICVQISHASWIVANDPLPRTDPDDECAVGEYNGKILLIGGHQYHNPRQGVEIDIDTHQVTDLGTNFLSSQSPGGRGQFWTQQAHIIYLIKNSIPSTFHTFDLSTHEYTTNWKGININGVGTNFGSTSCLASSDAFLFVVGGEDSSYNLLYSVQMLSLSTYSWTSNPPSMQRARHSHACLVYNEHLWAFGGRSNAITGEEDPSNERIQTTNIAQNTWYFVGSLTSGLKQIRAVPWYDTIYIVGGHDGSSEHDWVHLVNAKTGAVTLSPDRLPWLCDYAAPIIVNGILYVFGCAGDEWAYYTLPSAVSSTTEDPTTRPTLNPTQRPTPSPTGQPTPNPTKNPTHAPVIVAVPTTCPSEITGCDPDKNTCTTCHESCGEHCQCTDCDESCGSLDCMTCPTGVTLTAIWEDGTGYCGTGTYQATCPSHITGCSPLNFCSKCPESCGEYCQCEGCECGAQDCMACAPGDTLTVIYPDGTGSCDSSPAIANTTTTNPTNDPIASTSAPITDHPTTPSITMTGSDSIPELSTSSEWMPNIIILSVASAVLLIISCCVCVCILWRKKKAQTSVEFIATDPTKDNIARDTETRHTDVAHAKVITHQQQTMTSTNNYNQREAPGSLEGIRMTVEGDGNRVNHVNHGIGMDTDDGHDHDANEYQNNPNIAEDEFIVNNDQNAYEVQLYVTQQ